MKAEKRPQPSDAKKKKKGSSSDGSDSDAVSPAHRMLSSSASEDENMLLDYQSKIM